MTIWLGLTGGIHNHEPTRNVVIATSDDFEPEEVMVRMRLLEFVHAVPGFRRYRITEAGAAAVGLRLPDREV